MESDPNSRWRWAITVTRHTRTSFEVTMDGEMTMFRWWPTDGERGKQFSNNGVLLVRPAVKGPSFEIAVGQAIEVVMDRALATHEPESR